MIITADTITSKQRSKLRSLASNLQPVTQIGKGGVTDNLLKTLSDALEAHELIKVTILHGGRRRAQPCGKRCGTLGGDSRGGHRSESDFLSPFFARKFCASRIMNDFCSLCV